MSAEMINFLKRSQYHFKTEEHTHTQWVCTTKKSVSCGMPRKMGFINKPLLFVLLGYHHYGSSSLVGETQNLSS